MTESANTGVLGGFYAGEVEKWKGIEVKLGQRPANSAMLSNDKRHFKRMLDDLNLQPSGWNTPAINALLEEVAGKQGKRTIVRRLNCIAKSYQEHLREYVDLWLATGRDRKGSETPARRKPNKKIDQVVKQVFASYHAHPVRLKDGYTVSLLPEFWLGQDDEQAKAEVAFTNMLTRDWRLKIGQCNKCGRYFRLHQWERNYPEGTTCERCVPQRRNEASSRCMEKWRGGARSELARLVTERFRGALLANPKHWLKDAKLKRRMARYSNEQINLNPDLKRLYREGITELWFVRNREAIKEAL